MPEQDFTNREINDKFNNLMSKLDAHTIVHSQILNAVNETNGKVADVQKWRERMNGGSLVASFFFAVLVIPILTWAVYTLAHIETIIDESVTKTVSSKLI